MSTVVHVGYCTHINEIIAIHDKQLIYQTGTSIGFQPCSHIIARDDLFLVYGRALGQVEAAL